MKRIGTLLSWRRLAAAVVGLVAVLTLVVGLRTPSLAREWDADVRVLAGVDIAADGSVDLVQVRDWSYTRDTVASRDYFDATYHPDQIVDLWMYEQVLSGSGLIAHTFVVFEFGDRDGPDRYLGLSVETRREQGEQYSLIGGVMRAFEITHIWATERDLVRRRVEYLDYPLTRYRLDIPSEYRDRIFRQFVGETRQLAEQPQWYNTVTNNCTSSLVRYVNDNEPDAIPWHYSYVMTGRMDEYLESLGYLDATGAVHITRDFLATNPLR